MVIMSSKKLYHKVSGRDFCCLLGVTHVMMETKKAFEKPTALKKYVLWD